jgi:hypothetical protein
MPDIRFPPARLFWRHWRHELEGAHPEFCRIYSQAIERRRALHFAPLPDRISPLLLRLRREVVTPLNPAKWDLSEHPDGSVTLSPSIGNWGFPCKSHYLVIRNRVHWAAAFSAGQIARVQARDRRAVEEFGRAAQPRFIETLQASWAALMKAIKNWLRAS